MKKKQHLNKFFITECMRHATNTVTSTSHFNFVRWVKKYPTMHQPLALE